MAQKTVSGRLAEMRPYEPTLRERIGNWFYDTSREWGLHPGYADRQRNNLMGAVDFVPGLGDAVGVQDAAIDYNRGDYLNAAIGSAAAGVGLIPGAGDVAAKGIKKGGKYVSDMVEAVAPKKIRAFHGSPHDFDKFSMDKIGTGEGAQAYGHGLYFADQEAVAKEYKNKLATLNADGATRLLETMGGDYDAAIRVVDKEMARLNAMPDKGGDARRWQSMMHIQQEKRRTLEAMKSGNYVPGRMYEVEIDANPDDFLDWDAPLSEQSQTVQDALLNSQPDPDLVKFRRNKWTLPDWADGRIGKL